MKKFDIKPMIDAIEIKLKNTKKPDSTGLFFSLDKMYYETHVSSYDRTGNLFIRTYNLFYSEDVFMIDINLDESIVLMYIEDVQSTEQRNGTLPIAATEEEFLQYQFIEDTFGIDFDTYQSIMRVYELYEDYVIGRY
ncbi:hypothetical protein N0S44_000035 [Escherichia coli]|nr:hypothetical protein [Escherichia coli]EJR1978885.1 hypothetical protein [Escherichia coli]